MGRRGTRATTAGPACPCGSAGRYADCCGRLHRGLAAPATAEALMRSRFSAFALADPGYLLRTWHPRTRPPRLALDPDRRWLRLDVLGCTGGGLFDVTGTVEFRAHYRRAGRTDTMHERSRFERVDGRWSYLGPQPDANAQPRPAAADDHPYGG